MKHKAWFFYLIIFLTIINLASYLFFKYGNINKKVKDKISLALGKALNAKVSIDNLSLNDKQINITKLKIDAKDKSFSVCSKQIYIEYNLFSILKSRFKNFRGISLIKIYDPKIKISLKGKKKKKKEKKEFKIPDLRNYFKNLELVNGAFEFNYKTSSLKFSQKLKNINLDISNKKYNEIALTAIGERGDSLFAGLKLKNGKIKEIKADLQHYHPDLLAIKNFTHLDFDLNVSIKYLNDIAKIKGHIKNTFVQYSKWKIISDSLEIKGNDKLISIIFSQNSQADGFPLKGVLGIENYLKKPTFNAKLEVNNVDVEKYSYYVFGKANAKVNLLGPLAKPIVHINAFAKKLKVETETFTNVVTSAKYEKGKFSFRLNDLLWENNHLSGYGFITSRSGVVCYINKDNLNFRRYNIDFTTNLRAKLNYNKKLLLRVNLDNLTAKKENIALRHLNAKGTIKGRDWEIELNQNKNLMFLANGNFKKKNLDAKLKLKHLKLSKIFNKIVFPITSGELTFKIDKGKMNSKADIIFYDQNFGKFDGEIRYKFFVDKNKDKSMLSLQTKRARYNFEPFDIIVNAIGSADSLKTTNFRINDKIFINAFVKWKPKFDMGIKMVGSNINTDDILKYFTDYETLKNYKGKINFALNYNSWENKNIEGIVTAQSLGIGKIKNIDAYITFYGNKSFFTLDKMLLYQKSKKFFAARGNVLFKPVLRAKFIGKLQNLNIKEFLDDKSMKGSLNGDFTFNIKDKSKIFNLELISGKGKLFGIKIDSLDVAITQKDKLLDVLRCSVKTKQNCSFNAKGKLGYNFFSQNFYPLKDTLSIQFKGDLLKILKYKIKAIDGGNSKTDFDLKLSTSEAGLKIVSANFLLRKGIIKIKEQPVAADKITIDWVVRDNKLKIKKFKLRIGDGYLKIKNNITNTNKDFVFANVNLGKFLIETNSEGILLYIPGYVAESSFLKLKIKGRDSDYLQISGPFDDIYIYGDVLVSNGNLVYPPHTDNLLKIIKNPINTKNKESETIYPFSLDLMLQVGENVHYTTYPINLLMKKGGYLNLVYRDGVFSIPDAFFVSEKGNIDIFGTDMKADYVSVRINKLVNGFKLNAEFYKDIPDGTRVTMLVFTKSEKEKNKIQFKFLSDRPGDSTMDIISMLRYGKRIEAINPAQRNTLLQDELVQIAGLSIENAFITPLFYPFENFIKHLFRLDYFNIKTGIVQNVFNKYYRNSEQDEFATDENKITKFGTDMFLNNLTLQFTKQIYKKTYLDYTVSFQKSTNLAIQSKLGIYHNFSLKIEIPYKFRLSLDYKILPFGEKNSYQIGVEKSIKFY